ncbi:hypothetical protein GCM10009716_38560 [Streptomyces sodiiphilus]|uniref:Uncharacterized protein n=1 Tax=Streptomyces sodiiphilus TaxID=226217 RepID=A0ABN2PS41_9ACTN
MIGQYIREVTPREYGCPLTVSALRVTARVSNLLDQSEEAFGVSEVVEDDVRTGFA